MKVSIPIQLYVNEEEVAMIEVHTPQSLLLNYKASLTLNFFSSCYHRLQRGSTRGQCLTAVEV